MVNPYELADELDKYKGIATRNAANMLRQQADRIAELEKEVKSVAEQGENFWQQLCELKATLKTKPLSDEEIIKIRQATKATTAENWADTLAFARAIEAKVRCQ